MDAVRASDELPRAGTGELEMRGMRELNDLANLSALSSNTAADRLQALNSFHIPLSVLLESIISLLMVIVSFLSNRSATLTVVLRMVRVEAQGSDAIFF